MSTASQNNLSRLVEKQQQEVDTATQKIEVWTNYRNDYLKLKDLINSLPEKVRHPHNIPIAGTNLAFVPGHIIHTNELNVLLGDNIFALRSASQAKQIIDRRLLSIDDMLNKSKEAKRKAEDWLKATLEHKYETEEFVEIIESA